MLRKSLCNALFLLFLFPRPALPQVQTQSKSRPRVIVIGVNGMEWDILRPLLVQGELPNLASMTRRGVYGKLRTLSAPNCPKVYTAVATSTPPEQNLPATLSVLRIPLWA